MIHELEHAFDDCENDDDNNDDDDNETTIILRIPYHLIFWKTILSMIPSLEFCCFVCTCYLLYISQREVIY